MSPRAGRPSHLKPFSSSRVPSTLAYQAESTPGFTPRTPYSFRPAEITAENEEEDIEIKVHRSPSAPITPAVGDNARHKTRSTNRLGRSESSVRRWRFVTWSALVALVVIMLLSLYNVDPRHIILPQARSDTVADWLTNGGFPTTDIVHLTSTGNVMHPTTVMDGHDAQETTR